MSGFDRRERDALDRHLTTEPGWRTGDEPDYQDVPEQPEAERLADEARANAAVDNHQIANMVEQAIYQSGQVEDIYVEEDARTDESVFRIVLTVEGRTVHLLVFDGEGPE